MLLNNHIAKQYAKDSLVKKGEYYRDNIYLIKIHAKVERRRRSVV